MKTTTLKPYDFANRKSVHVVVFIVAMLTISLNSATTMAGMPATDDHRVSVAGNSSTTPDNTPSPIECGRRADSGRATSSSLSARFQAPCVARRTAGPTYFERRPQQNEPRHRHARHQHQLRLRMVSRLQPRGSNMKRHPVPPFAREPALAKVQAAKDAWNTRDPQTVAQAYTPDSEWRNRDAFFTGRETIVEFLTRKSKTELHYRLMKELWAPPTTGFPCVSNTNGSMRQPANGIGHTAMNTGSSMPTAT